MRSNLNCDFWIVFDVNDFIPLHYDCRAAQMKSGTLSASLRSHLFFIFFLILIFVSVSISFSRTKSLRFNGHCRRKCTFRLVFVVFTFNFCSTWYNAIVILLSLQFKWNELWNRKNNKVASKKRRKKQKKKKTREWDPVRQHKWFCELWTNWSIDLWINVWNGIFRFHIVCLCYELWQEIALLWSDRQL